MKKTLLSFIMLALPALAQTTVKDALVKHWKVTADFMTAVAKMMPAESYGFKPVPEELSFGQVVVQVAGANVNACANASGMPRPTIPELPGEGTARAEVKARFSHRGEHHLDPFHAGALVPLGFAVGAPVERGRTPAHDDGAG